MSSTSWRCSSSPESYPRMVVAYGRVRQWWNDHWLSKPADNTVLSTLAIIPTAFALSSRGQTEIQVKEQGFRTHWETDLIHIPAFVTKMRKEFQLTMLPMFTDRIREGGRSAVPEGHIATTFCFLQNSNGSLFRFDRSNGSEWSQIKHWWELNHFEPRIISLIWKLIIDNSGIVSIHKKLWVLDHPEIVKSPRNRLEFRLENSTTAISHVKTLFATGSQIEHSWTTWFRRCGSRIWPFVINGHQSVCTNNAWGNNSGNSYLDVSLTNIAFSIKKHKILRAKWEVHATW
jgi:hypothetical protein